MAEVETDPELAALLSGFFGEELASPSQLNAYQAARHALYLQAYAEMCETVTGEPPAPLPPEEQAFAAMTLEFLRSQRDKAYELICVRLNYCERRAQAGYLTILLPHFLLIAHLLTELYGWGLASVLWLVATDTLDKLCGCKEGFGHVPLVRKIEEP